MALWKDCKTLITGLALTLTLTPFTQAQLGRQLGAPSKAVKRQSLTSAASNGSDDTAADRPGWDALGQGPGGQFPPVPQNQDAKTVELVYFPGENIPNSRSSRNMFYKLQETFKGQGLLVTVQVGSNNFNSCPRPPCMTAEACKPFYRCFFSSLSGLGGRLDTYGFDTMNELFGECFPVRANTTVQCPITFLNVTAPLGSNRPQRLPCASPLYRTTADNWKDARTDDAFQAFINGGAAADNVYWPGRDTSVPFVQDLGDQMTPYGNLQCSIKQPCNVDLVCEQIGARSAFEGGREVFQSRAAYFIMVSLQNINRQLANQYQGINNALTAISYEVLDMAAFFPRKYDGDGISKALGSLGALFGLISGFIPVIGPGVAIAGTIASEVGSYVGDSLSTAEQADPLFASRLFAENVRGLIGVLLPTLEDAATKLFAGEAVGNIKLSDVMANGTWVSQNTLPKLSDLQSLLKTEIISRSINGMWKTFSSNKMWVLFTDLKDDDAQTKCKAHTRGPPDSKYCSDGGVYYTYNYHEFDKGGYVSYPWGADQLYPRFGINLTYITEASVKTYRLAKQNNVSNPFDVTNDENANSFLQLLKSDSTLQQNLTDQAGRYPGSWTLPVCDAGTWGESWQWDYMKYNRDPTTHPPCLCGPQGNETDMWQKAAGMADFRTFWHACTQALEDKDFQWPEGVTSVSYSGRDPKSTPYRVKKPGT